MVAVLGHLPAFASVGGRRLTEAQLDALVRLLETTPPKPIQVLLLDELREVPGQADLAGTLLSQWNTSQPHTQGQIGISIRMAYAQHLPNGQYSRPNTMFLEQARQLELVR